MSLLEELRSKFGEQNREADVPLVNLLLDVLHSKDTPQLCCGEPRMRERGSGKREVPRGGEQERSDAEEPRGSQKTCSPNTPSACCGDRTNKFYFDEYG